MSKMTLREVVDTMLTYEGGEKATMLGIGPMSKTLIKAVLSLGKEKDFPVMFIASRNQVDADEFGSGYVCHWDQARFAAAIKEVAEEVGFDGLYYLCRDHGGPWQRDKERNDHLPEDEAMALGKKSYLYDLLNGFDLLHIDPTKDPYVVGKTIDMDVNIRRTVELIDYVETERKKRGLPAISYEVGTEETNGGLTLPENYEKFIQKLLAKLDEKGLPHPSFIVGNTGTLTRLTEQVGHVDSTSCKELSAIAKKYGVGLKEHNGDYLDDATCLEHPALGVTAMNVAPEFGTVLREEAVKSGRWKKWMVNGQDKLTPEEIFKDEKLTQQITEISGHYTFNNPRVKEEIARLYKNLAVSGIDGEKFVIYKIQAAVDHYVECFNLKGLTSRLKKA